jgi:outer membrane lipoprotein-sorting protein
MSRLIISVLFVFFAAVSLAQSDLAPLQNVDEFKKQVQKQSGSIRSIQSAFEQEKHLAVLNEPARSSGNFYFSKAGSVRWEYIEPIQQSIILNNGNVTMINDGKVEKSNARAAKAYQRMNALMADVIHGNAFGNESFEYAFYRLSPFVRVEMTPKESAISAHIEKIELFFNADHRVEQLVIYEPGGDYTSYRFSDQRYNQNLPEGVFKGEVLE